MNPLPLMIAAQLLSADPGVASTPQPEPEFAPKTVVSVAPVDTLLMIASLEAERSLANNATLFAFGELSPLWHGAGVSGGARVYSQRSFEGAYVDAHISYSEWDAFGPSATDPFTKFTAGAQVGLAHVFTNRVTVAGGTGLDVGSVTYNGTQVLPLHVGDSVSFVPTARFQVGYSF